MVDYGGKPIPPRIILFSSEGTSPPVYLSSTELTHISSTGTSEPNTYAPWCAMNTLNGLLYTSEFDANFLYVYKLELVSGKLILDFLGYFYLLHENGSKLTVNRIQGGVISRNTGHLYLVSDKKDGGIIGFDMITGRRAFHKVVEYDPDEKFLWEDEPEELEGIDLINLPSGQIHLIMLDNDGNDDDVYFKHYKVESGTEDLV